MAEGSDLKQSRADLSEDSHYESFSNESKYDSFQDSLNVAVDLTTSDKNAVSKEINASNFLSEQVNVNGKKMLIDKKDLAGPFCDSLEDIHSLVSSGDRFSLSEEIEDINIVEINHTCDDSLKLDIANKNSNSNEICFDEDSLAILESEKAFNDSLDDSNGPSLSNLDSLMLSKSKAHDVDSLNERISDENKVAKSLFDSSIQIIYENSKDFDVDNLDDCNKKSSSVSEGIYRDSLEDLSDLPNQQNSSSSSSYKSMQSEPSMIKSANDLNDNNPVSKSPKRNNDVDLINRKLASKKSSTFLKPLTELMHNNDFIETICIDDSILPLDHESCPAGISTEVRNHKKKVSQNRKGSNLSLSPLDGLVSDDTVLYNVYDELVSKDDCVISFSYANTKNNTEPQSRVHDDSKEDKTNKKVSKLPLNANDDTILYDVYEELQSKDDSVISSSYISAKDNVEPQSTVHDDFVSKEGDKANKKVTKLSLNANDDTVLYDVNDELKSNDDSVLHNEKIYFEPQSKTSDDFSSMEVDKTNKKQTKLSVTPLHTNNSICLDDSLISSSFVNAKDNIDPQSFADNKDFVNVIEEKVNQKVTKLSLTPLGANSTICIDDSLISSSFVSACSISKNIPEPQSTVSNIASMEENKANDKVAELSVSHLEANSIICIEDSAISSSFVSACSFSKNNIELQSTANHNTDLANMELDKANVKNSNINETICIDDSIIEPQISKQTGLVMDNPKDDNVLANNTFVIEPVLASKPANVNETICIDDSIVEPFEHNGKSEITFMDDRYVKKNRRQAKNFETDFQKLQISEVDQIGVSHHDSTSNVGSTTIDIVVHSPVPRYQSNSNLSDKKKRNSKKISLSSPKTPNERNLKVHIELNQGGNVISVSEKLCKSPKKDSKYFKEMETEKEIREKNSNLEQVLCFTSKKLRYDTAHAPSKNKVEPNKYLEDLDVKFGSHDGSLLQALDLHDMSINVSTNESLQTRDSFMPLNLCVRERSFERPNKFIRNESKENIPFDPLKKMDSKKPNTPKLQKTCSPKKNKGTPLNNAGIKQQPSSCDLKKSATKIPIRKLNNTPLIQKKPKLDAKPPCNSDKPFKSPFIVPSCPKKDVSEGTPKHSHHFCMVRNSISKVPKSSQKITPKKFQNIQSPVAKYIGNPSVHIPLKTTHRYDGNLNSELSVAAMKTPKFVTASGTPTQVKPEKKL